MARTKQLDITRWMPELEEIFGSGKLDMKKPYVVIKKLTFGEISDMQDEVLNVQMIGRELRATPRVGIMRLVYLHKGIVEAPFPLTREDLRNIPPSLADYIYDELDKFNTPSPNSE